VFKECYTPLVVIKAAFASNQLDALCLASLKNIVTRNQISLGSYLLIFAATILLESPIYFLAGKYCGQTIRRICGQILLLNLATHPIVTWIIPPLAEGWRLDGLTTVLISEIFAPIVEAILLRKVYKYTRPIAILAAILANLCSWWLGLYLLKFD
jgi:hypothetical protein